MGDFLSLDVVEEEHNDTVVIFLFFLFFEVMVELVPWKNTGRGLQIDDFY